MAAIRWLYRKAWEVLLLRDLFSGFARRIESVAWMLRGLGCQGTFGDLDDGLYLHTTSICCNVSQSL